MHRSYALPAALLGALCSAPITAQKWGGLMANVPRGVIYDTGFLTPQTSCLPYQICERLEGTPSRVQPATQGSDNYTPDYDLFALFGAHFPSDWQNVKIDAMSTGNDIIPVDSSGKVIPNQTLQWANIMISVRPSATGQAGSHIRTMSASPQKAGSEMISLYFEGSYLPPVYPGFSYIEQSVASINPPPSVVNESAIDIFMPLIVRNGGVPAPFYPNVHEFYFSVTSSSAAQLPQSFFGGDPANKHGATVLKSRWDTTNGAWDPPVVVLTPSDVNLTAPNDDLDALAVNVLQGVTMFSSKITLDTSRPQIEVYLGSGPPVELTRDNPSDPSIPNGVQLIIGDDIDGLCGADPERDVFCRCFATAQPLQIPSNGKMNMSISRGVDVSAGVGDYVVFGASEWGNLPRTNGLVSYFFWFPTIGPDLYTIAGINRLAHQDIMPSVMVPLPGPFQGLPAFMAASFFDPLNPGAGYALSDWHIILI